MSDQEFFKINVEDLKTSIIKVKELRKNIKVFLISNGLSKEDIIQICNINQSQYYRRLNNNPSFSDTELLLIVDALLSKSTRE